MRQMIKHLQTHRAKRSLKKNASKMTKETSGHNVLDHGESSFGRLPTEIVLDILERLLFENSTPAIRTRLCLVSKSWCALFGPHGYPTLWSSITIPIPGSVQHMPGCIEYCHKCTLYSGMSQVDIVLDYTGTYPETITQFFLAFDERTRLTSRIEQLEPTLDMPLHANPIIMPLLILRGPAGKHMQRWRSLTIDGMREAAFYHNFIFLYTSYPAPNVISLACRHVWLNWTEGRFAIDPTLFFPNLRRLRLHSCPWDLSNWTNCIANLRHLELLRCSEDTFTFALLCQNLETLSLENASTGILLGSQDPIFPRLRSLSLMGRLVYYHPIWEQIGFPALEQIHLLCSNTLSCINGISYNLTQLSNIMLRDGYPSPKFPKLREVFLDLPKPYVSEVLDPTVPNMEQSLRHLASLKNRAPGAKPPLAISRRPV